MRIWDIDAGFLNTPSLLGEHRELHGMYSIIVNEKRGYSRHPETLRWKGFPGGLALRHAMLVAEMQLRGFNHQSPLAAPDGENPWPSVFLNEPGEQYGILREKYRDRPGGRIPLPGGIDTLWAHHKYSIMARGYRLYRKFGPLVARKGITFTELSRELTALLRTPPPAGSLGNALFHMWGHVSKFTEAKPPADAPDELLHAIRELASRYAVSYLVRSTALGELAAWIDRRDAPRTCGDALQRKG